MTEIATIDCLGRWRTSVFSENTAVFILVFPCDKLVREKIPRIPGAPLIIF